MFLTSLSISSILHSFYSIVSSFQTNTLIVSCNSLCLVFNLGFAYFWQIPKFFELCSDSVWGMRKACAECFMAVSYTTSPEVRRSKLSPLFISLISDTCRWVSNSLCNWWSSQADHTQIMGKSEVCCGSSLN